jgi:anti-sigma-K factor RskA
MTGPHREAEDRACGDDVAAYALGALDEVEAEVFRRHLDTCAICRDELAAFGQVVDLLPASVAPQGASPALRRRTMRAVRREAASQAGTVRRGATRPWALLPRPALALGAAVALAVVVVAGVRLSGSSSPSARTHVIDAQVTGVRGTAQLRLTGDRAELIVRHFKAPPAGQIYEVWLQRRTRLVPTNALFGVTAAGDGDVDVPGDLHGVSAVMVTPEPAGGTSVPTHAPVIRAVLT